MATNTDWIEYNEQGSAPATPATGKWRLFTKSDGLYLVDDGGNVSGPFPTSALSNPMTTAEDIIVGGTAGAPSRLAVGSESDVLTVSSGAVAWAPPSTGAAFTQSINQSGTSFAAWTAANGTWASNGTLIQQTATTDADLLAYYSTVVPTVEGVFEMEFRLPTAGQAAVNNIVGIFLGSNTSTTTTGARQIRISRTGAGTGNLEWVIPGTATRRSIAITVNLDTFYKLRVHASGGRATVWIDGTLQGSSMMDLTTYGPVDYFGLLCRKAVADYRNIKYWTPTLPA